MNSIISILLFVISKLKEYKVFTKYVLPIIERRFDLNRAPNTRQLHVVHIYLVDGDDLTTDELMEHIPEKPQRNTVYYMWQEYSDGTADVVMSAVTDANGNLSVVPM